jgi:hypothetical protein
VSTATPRASIAASRSPRSPRAGDARDDDTIDNEPLFDDLAVQSLSPPTSTPAGLDARLHRSFITRSIISPSSFGEL